MCNGLTSERLGAKGLQDLGSSVNYGCKFCSVCDKEHVKEMGGIVQQDGWGGHFREQ